MNFISSNILQNTSRLKAFKMSLDQVPLVPQLLRAAREGNELLLKDVFKQIIDNGMDKEDLNATDKSGRVSVYEYTRLLFKLFFLLNLVIISSRLHYHTCALLG